MKQDTNKLVSIDELEKGIMDNELHQCSELCVGGEECICASNASEPESWEEGFDNKFNIPHWNETGYNLKFVKDFIRDLLKESKEQVREAERERIFEAINKLKEKKNLDGSQSIHETTVRNLQNTGYQWACDDITKRIQE